MSEPLTLFVGIDWAKDSHDVCILNEKRTEVWRGKIKHSGEEIAPTASPSATSVRSAVAEVSSATLEIRPEGNIDTLLLAAASQRSA